MAVNIAKIRGTLEACVLAKNAIDSAVRVYEDAQILADDARNAFKLAEDTLRTMSNAALAQFDNRLRLEKELEDGLNGLIADIKSSRNLKKQSALATCLAARTFIDTTARRVYTIQRDYEAAVNVEADADAALSVASQAYTEKRRIYDDAVGNAKNAKNAILAISKMGL